jgi:formylmethanofuran dehydrogenase subunit B
LKVRRRKINVSPTSNTTADHEPTSSAFDGEPREMEHAWIAGEPVALDAAVAEAAKLLTASRHPLIAGLGTDVAGARAAVVLAQSVGAAIDHMHANTLLRDLEVMRSSGVLLTTPNEAHVRADTLLLVGPAFGETWPELQQRFLGAMRQSQSAVAVERRIHWICPGRDLAIPASGKMNAMVIGKELGEVPTLLASLRAHLAGRPVGKTRVASRKLDEFLTSLKAARFGVAIWSASALDALTIEMLCGLVDDLNVMTRFSGLPLAPADNAVGIMQTCAWMMGLPMRTGLGRGFPEHNPWLFDGRRLIASGETDCVLWISAYRAVTPAWREAPPTIALTGRDANFHLPPRVHISVGRPGLDHAGVEHLPLIGALGSVEAKEPSDTISVAEAIARIAAMLPRAGERAC